MSELRFHAVPYGSRFADSAVLLVIVDVFIIWFAQDGGAGVPDKREREMKP